MGYFAQPARNDGTLIKKGFCFIFKTGTIESTLQLKVKPLLAELSDIFDDPVANQTARAMLLVGLNAVVGNTSSALASSLDISRPLQGINLRTIIHYVQLGETIR